MRRLSVKWKLSLWMTALMAALAALTLLFMLSISASVATQTAMDQLDQTLRGNLAQITLTDGQLTLADGFRFQQNGVTTLIYSRSETLMAGQIPVGFTAAEPFQNGLTRTVSAGEGRYLVLDFYLPSSWDSGVWVRGLMDAPESARVARNLLWMAAVTLPALILLAAFGSYRIVRRAFRPLDSITATAAAISEARDLSRRIGLPPGRDEFSRLAAAFDALFERLERSFEAEKQFTADASHELRTPVSIIKGACEYAEKYDETPEERQETIAMIHRQAEKMSELIAQLLAMTRLEQGTELGRMETVDLAALAREQCEELGCDPARLILELPAPVTVRGDAALLARLVRNLVENAFKYGKPGGHVWVSAARQGNEAQLSVRDDGIGIPPEQQERVWQRFYQVDAARSGENGAGLGLSMVRQIAWAHGGEMTLQSIPEVGSVFTLHLPAV